MYRSRSLYTGVLSIGFGLQIGFKRKVLALDAPVFVYLREHEMRIRDMHGIAIAVQDPWKALRVYTGKAFVCNLASL